MDPYYHLLYDRGGWMTTAEISTSTTTSTSTTISNSQAPIKIKGISYLMNKIKGGNANADIVYKYYQEMDHEGLAESYRLNACFWVAGLAAHSTKPFKEITRQDIMAYLNTFRRSEDEDRQHRWIETYNLARIGMCRFFSK